MLDSEWTFKGKVASDSFQNFAYVSNYLHLKSFTWKRDYPISSKHKHRKSGKDHSRKAL